MMYQKRNSYNRRTTYRGGGIDWKRTIIHCAIFFILFSFSTLFISMRNFYISPYPRPKIPYNNY